MCEDCLRATRLVTDGGATKQPEDAPPDVQSETPEHPSLAATPPEEEDAVAREVAAYAGALTAVHRALVRDLRDDDVEIRLGDPVHVRLAVQSVFDRHGGTLDDRFLSMAQRGAEASRGAAARRFDLDLDPDPGNMRTQTVRGLRDMAFKASDLTQSRMSEDIADAIVDGYRAGLHEDEIARRLQQNVFPPMRQYEAKRIVRTELHAGGEHGKLEAFRESNAVREVMWISAYLPSTRSEHIAATGQTRVPGKQFSLAGYAAEYPGDMNLPVSQRVNCACRLIPAGAV